VANPAAIHPNQQVIFTASRDDGGPLNISTWYWQPDPGKPGSAGTACGWAANPSCQKQVAGSGTMTVYADVGYATAHVIVYTNFTLDVDQSTVNFGNIATFTPKYDGVPGPAARWRFDPSDTTTHDTQACESGVSQCQKVMLTTGRMWAFTSLTPGQGDSDSKVVTVKEPKLYLRALTRSGAKGRTVTFEPNWSDDTTVTAATWAWAPDTLPASTAACSGSPASCQAVIQQNGTMTATVSRQGITRSASAHVTIIPCPTKDTIADNMEVRDMLQDLFTSNHLGQPPENRREQIATIFYNPRTGEYRTQADYNHPNGTGYWCSTQPTWAPLRLENDPDSLFQQIALGHNHPVDPGKEDVPPDGVCNKEFQRRTPFAGPSPHDDDVAATGYPEFIIDATNIYRTDGPGKRQTWPHSGSCKLLTPHTLNLRPIGKPLIPQAPSVRSPNPNR
jgi:hypothetical protein